MLSRYCGAGRAITSRSGSSFNDLFDVSVFVDSQFIIWEELPNLSWRDSSYKVDKGMHSNDNGDRLVHATFCNR